MDITLASPGLIINLNKHMHMASREERLYSLFFSARFTVDNSANVADKPDSTIGGLQ